MPIEFRCHECDRLLRTSEDKAGRTAKCPGCGEAVAVPFPAEQTAEQPAAGDRDGDFGIEDDDSGNAYSGNAADDVPVPTSARSTKRCPMCGETIKAAALRCRFCGEEVADAAEVGRLPGSLEFGEVFSASWKLFSDQMGLQIGASLIVLLGGVVVIGVGVVMGAVMMAAIAGDGGEPAVAIIVAIVVASILLLVATAVQAYLTAGYNVFLLKSVRGEQAEISDLFSGGPFFLRMLANSLVFNLLLLIGMLLCYVPGILVGLVLWPYTFVLVDENRPGLESLRRAKELMEGNWWPVFLLMLVAGLIYSGAASVCPVAAIFVLPWMMVMLATIYCRLTGQQTVEG